MTKTITAYEQMRMDKGEFLNLSRCLSVGKYRLLGIDWKKYIHVSMNHVGDIYFEYE